MLHFHMDVLKRCKNDLISVLKSPLAAGGPGGRNAGSSAIRQIYLQTGIDDARACRRLQRDVIAQSRGGSRAERAWGYTAGRLLQTVFDGEMAA